MTHILIVSLTKGETLLLVMPPTLKWLFTIRTDKMLKNIKKNKIHIPPLSLLTSGCQVLPTA